MKFTTSQTINRILLFALNHQIQKKPTLVTTVETLRLSYLNRDKIHFGRRIVSQFKKMVNPFVRDRVTGEINNMYIP